MKGKELYSPENQDEETVAGTMTIYRGGGGERIFLDYIPILTIRTRQSDF